MSDPQLLSKIESIPESQMNPKFQEQLKNFCSYIFTHATGKRLGEGILVTGSRESLLQSLYLLWVSIRQSLGSWLELSAVIFAIQECGNAEVCVISGNPIFFMNASLLKRESNMHNAKPCKVMVSHERCKPCFMMDVLVHSCNPSHIGC